ncbi:LysR family transcriptional regulator, partial [Streptomyces varsoviensis]
GAGLVVDELTGLLRGRVAVGMVTSCAPLGLPDLLADFHEDHPGVEINLVEDNSDRLIAALRAGRLDTAVLGLAGPTPPGIETETVTDEPIVARDRALISLPRGTGLRTCLDEACAAAGFAPRIAFEAGDPNVLA